MIRPGTAAIRARPQTLSLLKTIARWALFLLVLIFVGCALRKSVKNTDWRNVHFRAPLIVMAGLCIAGMASVQLIIFRLLIRAYHGPVPWRVMMAVSWIPPLGKYLPGKVAALAGTIYLLRRHGVPAAIAFSVALIQDGMAVIAGLMVAAPLLGWAPIRAQVPGGRAWCAAVLAVGITFLHPRVFTHFANFVLKLLGRQTLRTTITLREYAGPLFVTFGQWLFIGLSLWCITRSIAGSALSVREIPFFIAVAALAMTLSYLALFAPGGIGVREGIFLLALAPVVGAEKAAVVTVAMRVLQTIMEMILATVGLLILRSIEPSPVQHPVDSAGAVGE